MGKLKHSIPSITIHNYISNAITAYFKNAHGSRFVVFCCGVVQSQLPNDESKFKFKFKFYITTFHANGIVHDLIDDPI